MKTIQRGFTLIELMMVVIVIGLLAVIAMPAYQDYSVRAKVSEAVLAISPAKTAVMDYFESQNTMPATAAQAGIEANLDTKYVNSVIYVPVSSTQAIIRVSVKALGGTTAPDDTLELFGRGLPHVNRWDCRPSTGGAPQIPNKYLPADCRQ